MLSEKRIESVKQLLPHLDERERRLFLAWLANDEGRGSTAEICAAFAFNKNTIAAGRKELQAGQVLVDEEGHRRQRKKGAGAKKITEKQPEIKEALERLVDGASYGDPENPLRWTTKSQVRLASELREQGFRISASTVARLLKELGFSLQVNQKKMQVGAQAPDRDEQFRHINDTAAQYMQQHQPVISVDCKKKENVGNFSNGGAEYAPTGQPIETLDHDFPLKDKGKAVPYGIYDIANNEGFVNLGISKDTPRFAVESITSWWNILGKERFPDATHLYITADGGGSNSWRSRLWKTELQKFSDSTGLIIEVSHFPPGTSKWNKIEHRLFSQITKNWRGRPLESLEVIVNLIASTTTQTGLSVECVLDTTLYETGIKVTDEQLSEVQLERQSFHGEWNYKILPRLA